MRDLSVLNKFELIENLEICGCYHTGSIAEKEDTIEDFSALANVNCNRISIIDCRHFTTKNLSYLANNRFVKEFVFSSFLFSIDGLVDLMDSKSLKIVNISEFTVWIDSGSDLYEQIKTDVAAIRNNGIVVIGI